MFVYYFYLNFNTLYPTYHVKFDMYLFRLGMVRYKIIEKSITIRLKNQEIVELFVLQFIFKEYNKKLKMEVVFLHEISVIVFMWYTQD